MRKKYQASQGEGIYFGEYLLPAMYESEGLQGSDQ